MAEEEALIRQVIAKDPQAVRSFIKTFGPVILSSIRRELLSRPSVLSSHPSVDEEDLLQDVLVRLFTDDFRVLRAWSPDKGRSLRTYLGIYATLRVIEAVRPRQRSMEVFDADPLLKGFTERDESAQVDAKDWLQKAQARFKELYGESDWEFFVQAFLEESTPDELAHSFHMTLAGVYQKKHRMRDRLMRIRNELVHGK